MIIASDNFTDPTVFVIVAVVNALGIIMLLGIARALSRHSDGRSESNGDSGDNRLIVDSSYMQARPRRFVVRRKDSPARASPEG